MHAVGYNASAIDPYAKGESDHGAEAAGKEATGFGEEPGE